MGGMKCVWPFSGKKPVETKRSILLLSVIEEIISLRTALPCGIPRSSILVPILLVLPDY